MPEHPPPTLLHAGSSFDGVVLLPRSARIEGRVRGRVLGERGVWVGADARVQGDVDGLWVVVEGVVEGSVRGEEQITLTPTARVMGGIHAPRLALADGARVDGTCRSGDAARAAPGAFSPLPPSP